MSADVSGVNRKRLAVILSVSAGVLLVAGVIAAGLLLNSHTIYKGIAVEGVRVSGMDREKATEILTRNLNEKYPSGSIRLKYGTQEQKVNLSEISYGFKVQEAIQQAYAIGRTGTVPERLKEIADAALHERNLRIEEVYDQDKLVKLLLKIKSKADQSPRNAQIDYKSGDIKILEDIHGADLDIDTNRNLLENQLMERNFDAVELKLTETMPKLTLEKINEIDSVISHFSTHFNTGDVNRSYNIKLACSKIDGTILLPGDTFSMNESLGPRTLENGYKEAPVIFKNELVPGTGGGVCQVTTTLYDAVLQACLKIVERSHHSMPLGYVQPGQDATIAEGSIDFKFKNDSDYPVCIQAEIVSGNVHIRILGRKTEKSRFGKLVSDILQEIPPEENELVADPAVADGQSVVEREPRKGIRVVLYRDVYDESGKFLTRDRISDDLYKPVKGKLLVSPADYNILKGS